MKVLAAEILLNQLTYIKSIPPENRKPWELRVVLEVYRTCVEEKKNDQMWGWESLPTEDIENIIDKKRRVSGYKYN